MSAAAETSRRHLKAPLLIALAVLFLAPFSTAIDLSNAFGGRKNGDKANQKPVDDAVANAKQLVDEMNDASTGTITSYQPNREKEPVSCNDIMAKALVVANEEKAAVIEERDSVVKAASLLSDRIGDLENQLKAANTQIETLKGALTEADGVTFAKLEEERAKSKEHMRMLSEDLANAKTKADREIKEMKDFVSEVNCLLLLQVCIFDLLNRCTNLTSYVYEFP
jgi:chromosome segregation ATPase